MIILGIDPGTATTGFGVVKKSGGKILPLGYGCILTEKHLSDPERLKIIDEKLTLVIKKYQPDHLAVEELFFTNNAKTAITVAQARGVVLLSGIKNKLSVFEYTPLEVKMALTGYGRAEKAQMQQMVSSVLGLSEIPKPDDAADALAVAVCHASTHRESI